MIITLCGSYRYSEGLFSAWSRVLQLSGHLVFASPTVPVHRGRQWERKALAEAQRLKINQSDAILLLNQYAYVDASTLKDVALAEQIGVKRYAVESWGKGNGIGGNHFPWLQEIVRGVFGEFPRSPFDTYYPHFRCALDLLSSEQPLRQKLVEILADVSGYEEE